MKLQTTLPGNIVRDVCELVARAFDEKADRHRQKRDNAWSDTEAMEASREARSASSAAIFVRSLA